MTKGTMEELVVESKGVIQKRIPPQIVDPGQAVAIKGTTKKAGASLNGITAGNFFVSLLMGSAMQQLWGTIRAM